MSWLGGLKEFVGTRIMGGWRSNATEPPKRGTREYLQLYETSPAIRAILGLIGGHMGSTEFLLRRSDTGAEVLSNLALDVLRKPNPVITGYDFWALVSNTRDLVGEAYLVKERNGLGAPIAYWPVPPHWVLDTPTPDRPFYQLRFNSLQWQVPKEEMVHLSSPSPFNPYARGSGIAQSLGDELEVLEYASKHAKAIFYNRAIPEVVVMDPGASLDDMNRHKQNWRNELEGFWRALKPYFTNRELKFWQPTQMNLDNLTMVPLMKNERDFVIQTYGIPPEQFGIVESSNRATIEGSDYVLEKRVIEPRRVSLCAQITLKMLGDYDPRLQLGFVSTVPEDQDRQIKIITALPAFFGESEIRARAGYPTPAPAADARMAPLANYFTDDLLDPEQRPKSSGGAPPAAEPKPEDEKPPKEGEDAETEE